MFFSGKSRITPDVLNILNDSTKSMINKIKEQNKWRYQQKENFENPGSNNIYTIVTLVSLCSFLFGYKVRELTNY